MTYLTPYQPGAPGRPCTAPSQEIGNTSFKCAAAALGLQVKHKYKRMWLTEADLTGCAYCITNFPMRIDKNEKETNPA